jgi:5-methylcytosine-specific restriction endonuclease McrA
VRRLVAGAMAAFLTCIAAPAAPHPGGLNASGCHTNRKTGDYHCHGAKKAAPAPKRTSYQTGGTSMYDSKGKRKRSNSARSAFRRNHSCPSTGSTRGACPGYEVDHVTPLACGGADESWNMQWLTKEANRSKGAMGCGR